MSLNIIIGKQTELQGLSSLRTHTRPFRTHWELFPHKRHVTKALREELTGILLHASYDALSSNTSTAPYSHADLQSMIKYAKIMERELPRSTIMSRIALIFTLQAPDGKADTLPGFMVSRKLLIQTRLK